MLRAILGKAAEKEGIENIYNTGTWDCREILGVPQQTNQRDCGMFVLLAAKTISENGPLMYTTKDMRFYRRKFASEIIGGYH